MAFFARGHVALNGGPGGPGLSVFNMHNDAFSSPTDSVIGTWLSHLHDLYDSVKGLLSSDVTYSFADEVKILSEDTGALHAIDNPSSPPADVTGTSGSGYAAGVGARIRWETSTIVGNRRVRGHTFLTPLYELAFNADGGLDTTTRTAIATAANTYLSDMAGSLLVPCIWHRPKTGSPTSGKLADIDSVSVAPFLASLRTRRF